MTYDEAHLQTLWRNKINTTNWSQKRDASSSSCLSVRHEDEDVRHEDEDDGSLVPSRLGRRLTAKLLPVESELDC